MLALTRNSANGRPHPGGPIVHYTSRYYHPAPGVWLRQIWMARGPSCRPGSLHASFCSPSYRKRGLRLVPGGWVCRFTDYRAVPGPGIHSSISVDSHRDPGYPSVCLSTQSYKYAYVFYPPHPSPLPHWGEDMKE